MLLSMTKPDFFKRNFTGEHFWARGYAGSTVGFEEETLKRYIRDQENSDGSGRF